MLSDIIALLLLSISSLALDADDTQLFIFSSLAALLKTFRLSAKHTALSSGGDWMPYNLCLYSAVNEFLLLHCLKPQLNIIHNPALVFSSGHPVPATASDRDLDFFFDSYLTISYVIFVAYALFIL